MEYEMETGVRQEGRLSPSLCKCTLEDLASVWDAFLRKM